MRREEREKESFTKRKQGRKESHFLHFLFFLLAVSSLALVHGSGQCRAVFSVLRFPETPRQWVFLTLE